MSQPAPPAGPGGSDGVAGALTPAAIDRVLADFRAWLERLADAPEPTLESAPEPIDLHTLVAQFTALRHEVNLQTRSARSALEQNAESLKQLGETVVALREAPKPDPVAAIDEAARPLVKALLDVYDALELAGRQVERARLETLGPALDALAEPPPLKEPPPAAQDPAGSGFLRRLFAGSPPADDGRAAVQEQWKALADWHANQSEALKAVARAKQVFDGLVGGYAMSLKRVERVLPQFDLEPITCVGRPFDPELMEVVEATPDSGRPAGEVLDEVRRGYLWRGRVFRYAQVRVAR
jgi:molecular chaperone GrpE